MNAHDGQTDRLKKICCGNKQRQVGEYLEAKEAGDAGSAGDFALELVNEFFLFLQ
jgi:hypothetical protein